MPESARSPYLHDPNRLGDVIAAIQAMATYKFYKLEFAGWAERIVGDANQADHWRQVFQEHPEFFRLDTERVRASLVWRRQHRKRFNVDSETMLTDEEYSALSPQRKTRVSRAPLGASEVSTLIKTATDLHSRALEQKKESRWWLPIIAAAASLFGSVTGALIGALLKVQK